MGQFCYTVNGSQHKSRSDFSMPIMGNRLKELRERKQYSLQDMGDMLGVSYQAYRKWEKGNDPSIDHLREVCKILSCSADYLFGLTDQPYKYVEFDQLRPDQKNLLILYDASKIPRPVKKLLGDPDFLNISTDNPTIENPAQGSVSSEEKTA